MLKVSNPRENPIDIEQIRRSGSDSIPLDNKLINSQRPLATAPSRHPHPLPAGVP